MDVEDLLTRWTVRAAFAAYALAEAARLYAPESASAQRIARVLWTGGCTAYLAHVACAFGFYHHWSHAAAYAHTAKRTGELIGLDWGGGLYFNYLFTAIWLIDVVWWWRGMERYANRPVAIGRFIHGFMAFMFFQATVVFAAGPIRWAGIALFVGLAFLAWRSARSRK